MKKVIVTCLCMLLMSSAFAKSFSGGKSRGMYSSSKSSSYSRSNSQTNNNTNRSNFNQSTSATAEPKKGVGLGTVAAGAAVAGAAGYMLGSHNSDHEQNNNQIADNGDTSKLPISEHKSNNADSSFSIIMILIIVVLVAGGFFLYRRNKMFTEKSFSSASQDDQISSKFTADGTNKDEFLRKSKGIFCHIQSMNNAQNIDEISKYMTDEMYLEMKQEILANEHLADFKNLDCNIIDSYQENSQYVTVIRFFGECSQEPTAPYEYFSERWIFTKQLTSSEWLLAGIEV